MRLAPLLVLLPALAEAQIVPSLRRTGPSLPIAESVETLQSRLGGPGGLFAAAQLALKGDEGRQALVATKDDPKPLRRLDVAYGLGLRDDRASLLALATMLGDADESVTIQATLGFVLAGSRGVPALWETAFRGRVPAADGAAMLLPDGPRLLIARNPNAAGRAGALRTVYGGYFTVAPSLIPLALEALNDRRPAVRAEAARRIVWTYQDPKREDAFRRLLTWPDPIVRAALVDATVGLGDDQRVLVLTPLASDRSPEVRRSIAGQLPYLLSNGFKDARLLTALVRLIDDPDPKVADLAVERTAVVVGNSLGSSNSFRWERIPASLKVKMRHGLLRTTNGPQRFNAGLLLAVLRDRAAYDVVLPFASDPNTDRTLALNALGLSGDPRATPRLLGLTRDPSLGPTAFAALGYGRDPAAVTPLLRFVRDDPRNLGISAAYALARIGDRRATPTLLATTRALPRGYAANYFDPLATLGGPGVREILLDALENGPETTTGIAANALTHLHDRAAIPNLERLAAFPGKRGQEAKHVLGAIGSG